jgi:hypothetical protein
VVAVRLSVWLAEVDLLITVKLEQYKGMVSGSIPKEFWSPLPLKLNVSGGIEAVMSELHYLRKGASDVELWPKVGEGVNRGRRHIVGVFEPPLLHRRSDMPCRTIPLSN